MHSRFTLYLSLVLFLALWAMGCQQSLPVEGTPPTPNGIVYEDDATWLERGRPDPNAIPDRFIVVFNDDVSTSDARNLSDELARASNTRPEFYYKKLIKGFSAKMSNKAASKLLRDKRVKSVEPDYRCKVLPRRDRRKGKTDKNPGGGDGGGNTGGGGDTAIGDPGTPPVTDPPVTNPPVTDPPVGSTQEVPWGVTSVGGPVDGTGKVCWIVDTGIDLINPDLNVDVSRSKNFVADGSTSANDGNGHGTHCAGIIAAKNNSIGVVGVAPNATVVSIRVLDNTANGTYASLLAGLDYIMQNAKPGDVVNMSLAGPPEPMVDNAVIAAADKGIIFVISAGNFAADAGNYTPGRVRHQNVYTISAVGEDGCLAWFSNWGNPPISYAAPGVGILSLLPGGGTITHSGTSMSAPHVAGLLLTGRINASKVACGDPDGTPDAIAHR
jgi:subtilisin family serine protease